MSETTGGDPVNGLSVIAHVSLYCPNHSGTFPIECLENRSIDANKHNNWAGPVAFVRMNSKIAPFIEYVAESTTACLVTMVHGNVLALTLGHLLIASQTGVVAGTIAAVSLAFSQARSRLVVSAALGVTTSVADFFVHPGMFGSVATEAVVTGIGAAVLSYLFGLLLRVVQGRGKRAV